MPTTPITLPQGISLIGFLTALVPLAQNWPMYLSAPQARRIALAAQGIGGDRDREVTMHQVQRVISTLGQFQIDTVNVLVRAHLMPLFTRLGTYDTTLLTRASSTAPRRLFEFWGHAASLIDINLYPHLQFRRENAREQAWGRHLRFADNHPEIIEQLAEEVRRIGPATARDLDLGEDRLRDHWGWNWSHAKAALEWLFWCGRVSVSSRNSQFERVYDIPERVIPSPHIEACQPWVHASPSEKEELTHIAHVELVRRAARALGVGTARCIADYFRTASPPTKAAIHDLVNRGELIKTEVEGFKDQAYVWHEAARPRKITTATLVSPFDSLIFERKRLANLFDIDYTIGIYTPVDKRIHGYYVYLFLLDDAFAARCDLKADRAAGTLLVQSAWLEPHAEPGRDHVAAELAGELRRLADWLALSEIRVADKGDLAPTLRRQINPVLP